MIRKWRHHVWIGVWLGAMLALALLDVGLLHVLKGSDWLIPALIAGQALVSLALVLWSRLQVVGSIAPIRAALGQATDGVLGLRVRSAASQVEIDDLADQLNAFFRRVEDLLSGLRNLSSNVAHELASPIHALIVELEDMPAEADAREAYLVRHQDRLRDLLRLFNGVLEVTRVAGSATELKVDNIDLREIGREVADVYSDTVDDAGCQLVLDGDPVWIIGSAMMLRRAIANLVSNAVRFSPRGGRVTITTGWRGARPFIAVSDQGQGVAEETFDDLLLRVGRSDRGEQGFNHGLGLRLVQATAWRHGGEVVLAHPSDGGLIMRIDFPAPKTITLQPAN